MKNYTITIAQELEITCRYMFFFSFEMVYLVLSYLQVKFKENTNNSIHATNTTWTHALQQNLFANH